MQLAGMRFRCPSCGSRVWIEEMFGGDIHVSCGNCRLEDTLPFNANPDESFLEFLVRYDRGLLPTMHRAVTNKEEEEEEEEEEPSGGGGGSDKLRKKEDSAAATEVTKKATVASVVRRASQAVATEVTKKAAAKRPNRDFIPEEEEGVRPESEIRDMIGDENPDELTRSVIYSKKDYLADYRTIKEPGPEYGRVPDKAGLDGRLAAALTGMGIRRFYKFQDDAIKSIASGNDTVIEAPTASGKTEAFLVPVIQRIIESEIRTNEGGEQSEEEEGRTKRRIHAILVYPTKALARDQLAKIQKLAGAAGLSAEVFDGDTESAERNRIISSPPHILVTNFDLLHFHMWLQTPLCRILRTARMLIVDEAHTYTGIFGSNVHYVIKRLARIAGGGGGNNPQDRMQFVAASATFDDPERFCSELFGIDKITTITGTGGSRHVEFAMLFPSRQKPRTLMVNLTEKFTASGHQTMAFSNSHRSAELLAIYCKRRGVKITVHRAGLMPSQRESTEKMFKGGSLQAISCTPTLELGIDVGSTDCVISQPTPINRLIQRIGRAARRKGRHGYAFLVLGDDPISQYYKNHPSDYYEDVERLYIDPHNPYVKECQILAMAYDMPLGRDEATRYADVIRRHTEQGNLKRAGETIVPNRNESVNAILRGYSIRGAGESIDIVCNGRKVADRTCPIALEELHEGAVYFLAGRAYVVNRFDYPETRHAVVEELPSNHPYYTRALTSEYPSIEEVVEKREVYGIETAFCRLRIRKILTGYVKIDWTGADHWAGGGRNGGSDMDETPGEAIHLDRQLEYTYVTKGIVFRTPCPYDEIEVEERRASGTLPSPERGQNGRRQSATIHGAGSLYGGMGGGGSGGGGAPSDRHDSEYVKMSAYHATEHVVIEGSNMITGGAARDMGGISMGSTGMIFIHDGVIGGSGASRALYDRLESAFERGARIVGECPCTARSGCPRCTMSYRCGNNNQYLHKMAALEVFERINGGEYTTLLESFDKSNPIV